MSAANFANPNRIVANDKLDNAYATSNLPLRGAKCWLYEGGIRVPMIIIWPGQAKGATICEETVISTDLYPSLIQMVGLLAMPNQAMDAKSFVTALKGCAFEREAISWHFPRYNNHRM